LINEATAYNIDYITVQQFTPADGKHLVQMTSKCKNRLATTEISCNLTSTQ